MARIYPLFSSSKGNATYIGNSTSGILVDAGVTYKRLAEGLQNSGLSIDCVKAVFVTHEHSDHIKGLAVLTKCRKVPVYATKGTLTYLMNKQLINSECFEITDKTDVCDMEISNFRTSHDAAESCGYRITSADGKTCCVCTDLGHLPQSVFENLCGSDAVLLESNYDEAMLSQGSYPYYLKARIASDIGHLSNTECSVNIKKLIENGTTRFILGHLSQENNIPHLAEERVLSELSGYKRNRDFLLDVAPVQTNGKCMIF